MKNVRLQTRAKLSDREDAPTKTVTISPSSGLGSLDTIRQRQVESRLAGDLAAVEKKNNRTKLLMRKQAELDRERTALEAANKRLSDMTQMQDRVALRAAIETHAGNVATLEAEVESLKQTLVS